MKFLGGHFFEKKCPPNPLQKASIWERDLIMPLWFGKSAAVRELEEILAELQSNLENNYKDAAQNALRRLKERTEELRGSLKEKEYKRFSVLCTEYSVKMTGYHH